MWDHIPDDEARVMQDVWAMEDARERRREERAHVFADVPEWQREMDRGAVDYRQEESRQIMADVHAYLDKLDNLDVKLEHEAPLTEEERALYTDVFGPRARWRAVRNTLRST